MLGWIWGNNNNNNNQQQHLIGRVYQSSGISGWKEVFIHGATLSLSLPPSSQEPFQYSLFVSAGEDQKYLLNDDEEGEMNILLGHCSNIVRESPQTQKGWFDLGEELGVSWERGGEGKGERLMFVCEKETEQEMFENFCQELARGVWRAVNKVEGTMDEEEGVKAVLRSFGEGEGKGEGKGKEKEVEVVEKKGRGVEEGKGKEKEVDGEEKSAFVMLDEIGYPPKGYCLEVRAHLHERIKKDGADFYRLLYKDCGAGLCNISSEDGFFAYSFYVRKGPVQEAEERQKNTLFEVAVNDHLQPQFSFKDMTFRFYLSGTDIEEFRLQFTNKDAFGTFRDGFLAFHWESSFQTPFTRLPKADRIDILSEANHNYLDDYDLDDLEGVLKNLALEDDFEEGEEEEGEGGRFDYDGEEDRRREEVGSIGGGSEKYSGMTQSRVYGHCFVHGKGNRVELFLPDEEDGSMQEVAAIGVRDSSNVPFSPHQLMTYSHDSHLLATNSRAKQSLFSVDLERPDIVEEWSTGTFDVDQVYQKSKFNEDERVISVLNEQGTYLVDPRLPGNKVVTKRSRFFTRGQGKRSAGLTCAATSARGDIVMGNEIGEIRMFSHKIWDDKEKEWNMKGQPVGVTGDVGQGGKLTAKTRLPSRGSAIKAIDITQDGSLVVCTTKTFLLVFPTVTANGKSGFEGRGMGRDKPPQFQLRLSFEHTRELGEVDFTPAKFNSSPTGESVIVTSSGPYVVTWSFTYHNENLVISNEYKLKRYHQNVIAPEFRQRETDIVVLLPHDVTLAKKTRKALFS